VSQKTTQGVAHDDGMGFGWPVRVVVAKIGMDGHDRGARIVARALRDGGMEVVYTGRHVAVASIVKTAIDEDVDVIGLSILSGAHVALTKSLFEEMERQGVQGEFSVVVGGTGANEAQRQALIDMGVADVFPGGTPLPSLVARVEAVARERRRRLGL
jgi:methylmalonyl-CoA mutase, C-terminal domain